MLNRDTEFRPDFLQEHPGTFLKWVMEERGIKVVDLAKRCGRPTKTISEIISGTTAITPDTAIQFERVLGEGASFWISLDANYRLQQARLREFSNSEKSEALEWAKSFPVSAMKNLGFLEKGIKGDQLADAMMRFFGVSSVKAWHKYWGPRVDLPQFKQNQQHSINELSVAAWLRQGEITAEKIETNPYSETKFKAVLPHIRSLTQKRWSETYKPLIEICSDAGVAVALVPHLKNSGLRGAAYWAHKDKAVIILSDQYKSEERIWFSFFHEVAHILLHSKKAFFIDDKEKGSAEKAIENEADLYSADFLVSRRVIDYFKDRYGFRARRIPASVIRSYAKEVGVSPGLLLERLQHEEIIQYGTNLDKVLKRKVVFEMSREE